MMDGYLSMMHGSAGPIGHTGISADPEKNNDYLLIKNLPGYKAGCIFTMEPNYIYYISHDPDRKGWQEIFDKAGEPHIDYLIKK